MNGERPITWRRFVVLLAGLGPQSLWVLTHDERPRVIDNPRAAEHAVFSVFD